MGIFFVSSQPVLPTVATALREALIVDPGRVSDVDAEVAKRTVALAENTSPQFNAWRFVGAIVIAAILLWAAIWTAQHNLPDISKALMNSFAGFSGLVLGLLGGEAQKATTS